MASLNIISSAYGDKAIELAGAQILRKIDIGTNWNKIRFVIQYSFSGGNTLTSGTPKLAIGLCSGDTYGFLTDEVLMDKFIGWASYSGNWTYTAGPPSYYQSQMNAMRVVAGVRTDSFGTLHTGYYTNQPDTHRGVIIIDVTKGSPNWTFDLGIPISAVAPPFDMGEDRIIQMLELAEIYNVINTMSIGYLTNHYTIADSIVDDGVTPMDTLHISWSRSDVLLEIGKISWRRIS